MYNWLADLDRQTKPTALSLHPTGATTAALDALEADLGCPLAASHRAFLACWDGAPSIDGFELLSVSKLRAGLDQYNFEPVRPKRFRSGLKQPSRDDSADRTHLFASITVPFSADLFCFDTARTRGAATNRNTGTTEYPLVRYDHETGSIKHKYPSLEAFILHHALILSQELDSFDAMTADAEATSATEPGSASQTGLEFQRWAQRASSYWQHRLEKLLIARGATMTNPWWPTWERWVGSKPE